MAAAPCCSLRCAACQRCWQAAWGCALAAVELGTAAVHLLAWLLVTTQLQGAVQLVAEMLTWRAAQVAAPARWHCAGWRRCRSCCVCWCVCWRSCLAETGLVFCRPVLLLCFAHGSARCWLVALLLVLALLSQRLVLVAVRGLLALVLVLVLVLALQAQGSLQGLIQRLLLQPWVMAARQHWAGEVMPGPGRCPQGWRR
jgi:hypothetical protein